MPRHTITNFSRGEFGPELYGRVDIPQYSAGAKELTNFHIERYGGARFRPGFRFAGEVDDATKTHRYIPFQFSIDQAYVLVLENKAMRALAAGGFVTETNLKILSVTQGATTTLEANHHNMSVGDRIYIDGVVGMVELNGQYATVTAVPDSDHVTVDIDSTGYSAFISSDGTTRTETPEPPDVPETPPPDPPAAPPPPTTTTPPTGDGTGAGIGTPPATYEGWEPNLDTALP